MSFFFLENTAHPEIHPLPQHAPLRISRRGRRTARPRSPAAARAPERAGRPRRRPPPPRWTVLSRQPPLDRKSTRLNSSHANISYAVFCLKKKKQHVIPHILLRHQHGRR